MTHPKTAKNLQLNIAIRKSGMGTFRTNLKMWVLKHKRCKKLLIKVAKILGKVAENFTEIKHNKDMTAGDMKNAVMPLI